MIIQEVGGTLGQVYMCREDLKVEVSGKLSSLHVFYDWGASVTMIAHRAARAAGLMPIRQPARQVMGLGGTGVESTCYYFAPMADAAGKLQVVKAIGVSYIARMPKTRPLGDLPGMFRGMNGKKISVEASACDVDMLVGLDNSRWMPTPGPAPIFPDINLRLVKSAFSGAYIAMGQTREGGGERPTGEQDGARASGAQEDRRMTQGRTLGR
jgi:hypothetical protein